MSGPSTRFEARRRRSAKARNRGRRIADGAAGYGELASRGIVTMIDFGSGRTGGRVGGGVWRAGTRVERCLVAALEEG
jgi:hypothetical protein